MGKRRIRQEAAKTAKTEIVENKKQQLNSLLKAVLRPKVYITDTSSFKTLVQELTGNHIYTNTCAGLSDDNRSPGQDMPAVVFEGTPDQQRGKESSVDSLSTGFDDQEILLTNYYGEGLFLEDDQFHDHEDELMVGELQRDDDEVETWAFEAAEQYYYPNSYNYCDGSLYSHEQEVIELV